MRQDATRRSTQKSTEPSSRPGIQVIARAARVLRALEGEQAGLSLGQIAQRVGLARSTVQRIVESLSAEQFVIAAGPSAGVRLGPALLRLASSASAEIHRFTRPIMVELSRSLGETVDLSIMKGTTAVFIDQVPGSHRLRAVSAVGEVFPLHCTANGKALLGMLPVERRERLLRGTLARNTANTVVRPSAVLADVATCRARGYALDEDEHTEGICAVGVAFVDPLGRPVALSIPIPSTRFKKRRSELIDRLLACRKQIIEQLGTSQAQDAK
ncbi:MAG TPA: IclR family transcriptional regulator [Polyangiales bacterium]|nr:IclR family transcriptional regulator [Polyangiales bacterium]